MTTMTGSDCAVMYNLNITHTHTHTHTHTVDEHRMGTGTGTGTEARTVGEMGEWTRMTGIGTRIGSWRAEERRRSARNRKIVVDAMWETRKAWVEKGKNVL